MSGVTAKFENDEKNTKLGVAGDMMVFAIMIKNYFLFYILVNII